jgi:hypothetical protein
LKVHTASFRTTRGYTIVVGLCDELAFWTVDENSAEPDVEVLNALRPGMALSPTRRRRVQLGQQALTELAQFKPFQIAEKAALENIDLLEKKMG